MTEELQNKIDVLNSREADRTYHRVIVVEARLTEVEAILAKLGVMVADIWTRLGVSDGKANHDG